MSEYSQESLSRMEALVRRMATGFYVIHEASEALAEAKRIADILPPLPDPDIEEARKLRLEQAGEYATEAYKRLLAEGTYDSDEEVQLFLKAIKLGRSLEAGK